MFIQVEYCNINKMYFVGWYQLCIGEILKLERQLMSAFIK